MTDKARGRFVWHDLMTADPKAAVAFYTKVAGWGTQSWDSAEAPYTMWTAGDGKAIGGVMGLPPGGPTPPNWLGYIGTPDVDATVAEMKQRGGSVIVPPRDIPTVGRFAVLIDPQGAAFAGFTALNDAPGHDGPAHTGEFSWHELATTDPVAALEFYQSLFGWEKTSAMDMGEMGTYQMFGLKGHTFGGVYRKPAEMAGPPAWMHYALVKDVHLAVDTINALGGKVVNGPMEVPGGDMIAQAVDPQGAFFAIHATKK